jgi:hypothetical protein
MRVICLILALSLAACATCKSSDTAEQCRTKVRDKQQRNATGAALEARGITAPA